MNRKYGWRPQLPDHRDFLLTPTSGVHFPSSLDMRSKTPSDFILNQGELGSCSAHSIVNNYRYFLKRTGKPDFHPSRLFVYYNERVMEGTVDYDAGAVIRDGIKSLNKQGVCSEQYWPYDISKFTNKPTPKCYADGLNREILRYSAVSQTLTDIKTALVANMPISFGFTAYDSFESQDVMDSGVLNLPGSNESVLGGHAVLIMGYDDSTSRFLIANSWGTDWGQKGYFTMPYNYVTNPNLASDFWVLNQ